MKEQQPNSGVLFKNDKKETEKHPDYKGWGEVNGVSVWIAAWIKTGAKGKFMSLSIKPKDEKDTKDRGAFGLKDQIPF